MERPNDSIKKSKRKTGSVFGFLSITIALIAYTISIILFPGGYNFIKNYISEFGIGPYGFIFNFAIILSGIVVIPYYFALASTFDDPNINPRLKKSAIFFSMFSVITLLMGILSFAIRDISFLSRTELYVSLLRNLILNIISVMIGGSIGSILKSTENIRLE